MRWFRRSDESIAIAALERANQRLLDALIELASAGRVAPASVAASPPEGDDDGDLMEELPPQVRDAIAQMADRGTDEEVELEMYARRRLAEDVSASDVAHEILEGQDPLALLE